MPKAEPKQSSVHSELERVEHRLALLENRNADPREAEEKKRLRLTERERGDVRTALGNPAIRRFLYRLLNLSGILAASGDPNPTIMAHHEGRRSIGLEIYQVIKDADPGAYFQMEREYESNLKSEQEDANAS